jgi:hypothetical protein
MTSYLITPHLEGPNASRVQGSSEIKPSSGIPLSSSLCFDRYEMGVRPFVFPRCIDTYKHFILLFVLPKMDPRYQELFSFLEDWMKQTKFTIGSTQPICFKDDLAPKDGSTKHKNGFSRLSPEKVYFCDLRNEKDARCGFHLEPHPESWVTNQAASIALDRFRGLIVFADNIDQIPSCWVTKSIGGLTSDSNIDTFLKKGLGVRHHITAETDRKQGSTLNGYIKMVRNAMMTTF